MPGNDAIDAVRKLTASYGGYTEHRQAMRQKISLALIYPALLTIAAILVLIADLTP